MTSTATIYDYISGCQREREGGSGRLVDGRLQSVRGGGAGCTCRSGVVAAGQTESHGTRFEPSLDAPRRLRGHPE